ncbi:MAG: hypothetical protein ACRDZ4_00380 [Egibacteraceae bacterium]
MTSQEGGQRRAPVPGRWPSIPRRSLGERAGGDDRQGLGGHLRERGQQQVVRRDGDQVTARDVEGRSVGFADLGQYALLQQVAP